MIVVLVRSLHFPEKWKGLWSSQIFVVFFMTICRRWSVVPLSASPFHLPWTSDPFPKTIYFLYRWTGCYPAGSINCKVTVVVDAIAIVKVRRVVLYFYVSVIIIYKLFFCIGFRAQLPIRNRAKILNVLWIREFFQKVEPIVGLGAYFSKMGVIFLLILYMPYPSINISYTMSLLQKSKIAGPVVDPLAALLVSM